MGVGVLGRMGKVKELLDGWGWVGGGGDGWEYVGKSYPFLFFQLRGKWGRKILIVFSMGYSSP